MFIGLCIIAITSDIKLVFHSSTIISTFDTEIFNLRKLNDVEAGIQYQTKISSLQLWSTQMISVT